MDNTKLLELRSNIRHHNHLYYDLDSPVITDKEYDLLIQELKEIDPEDPVLTEIGNPTYGTKIKHSSMMGSLNKIHDASGILSKFQNQFVIIMPKIDGMSLSLRYKNGHLDSAVTRGDGKVGELVTPCASRISNIPLKLSNNETVEIRGEAFIPKDKFYGIMDQPGYDGRDDGYLNPRNATAGAIRQKDPSEVHNRNIQFVAYRLLYSNVKTHIDCLRWLHANNFLTVPYYSILVSYNQPELEARLKIIYNTNFQYNIDGAVIMINDLKEFESLGYGSKCPKGAIAYKYKTKAVESYATNIKWDASRSGRIVPVLEIEPTKIDGTVVSKISLNNYKWMMDKDVAIGDKILFTKANEIIPYLIKVTEVKVGKRDRNIPTTCPSCEGPLVIDDIDLRCNNQNCGAKFIKWIRRILQVLDIKGIDEKTLYKMEAVGLLKNPWDIFDITEEELIKNGFGETQSKNWTSSLTNIEAEPKQILACMTIEGWGRRMFEILFSDGSIDPVTFLDGVCGSDSVVLNHIDIHGIGDERLKVLKEGICRRRIICKELLKRIQLKEPEKNKSDKLQGTSFCCTGTLSRKRKEIENDIKNLGGEIKGVSKNLDYLVVGDSPGSKVEKAKKADVKIITEDELNQKFLN